MVERDRWGERERNHNLCLTPPTPPEARLETRDSTPHCFALLTLNTSLTRVSSKFHQILSFSQLKHLLGLALIRTRSRCIGLTDWLWVSGLNHNVWGSLDVSWSDVLTFRTIIHILIILSSVLRPSGLQMVTNNSSHKLVWHDPL